MTVYFADRHLNILGQAGTGLRSGLIITADKRTEDIQTGIAVFECEIHFEDYTRSKATAFTEVGNYLLHSSDSGNEFYTITETETDTKKQTVSLYAEDAGLDLINEVTGPYEADKEYPISHYINKFAEESGFEIGINEAVGRTRKLSWKGEATATERIASVAAQFGGCEIAYSFEVQGLAVTKKLINIYEERGKELGVQLRLNQEVDSIVTVKSITGLATALQCTGGTAKNAKTPITLAGYQYDDGDFFVDGTCLKSRKALERWSRCLWKNSDTGESEAGWHIVKPFSCEAISQAALCQESIAQLKKMREMEVNYDVDIHHLPSNAQIGDRINIIDDAGALYLSTRILMLERSECDQSHRATLGEHLIKGSGISERVEELAKQFAEAAKNRVFYTWTVYANDADGTGISVEPEGKAYLGIAVNQSEELPDLSDPTLYTWSKIKGEDGEAAYRVEILSDNGNVFKNGEISTVLRAQVYRGSEEITEQLNAARFRWTRKSKDEAGDLLWNQRYFGGVKEITVTNEDVQVKATFSCSVLEE